MTTRTLRAALVALLAVTTAASCGTSPEAAAPAPSPTPVASTTPTPPPPGPAVPDVPVVDAGLDALPAPAPAPVRVAVPDLGIDMPVDAVGVEDDGTMEIPEDADRAGWYRYGPAPATPEGATVVAAHVDSWTTGIGPFSRLRDVAVGARVEVTTADGTVHAYVVREVTQVPKTDAPVAQWFDRTGAPRIVLVTCGGAFDREVGHYADNVAVTADPVVDAAGA
ncbi:peptidase C60 sortase A and B [Cellulomonas flavigena DSM 20109]|uniref:Peptidase C60 sortase A and B n=1 Tax=Cellulomonas flavigena (strain ATCC 482 / DSM 20109 / BCRC 11376 / JCM 18109 / NBRC 3775 / NCIMB 8073 / NRS 134) TaxID=446466 RepID=D5UHW5_CELFN|nr:class F sortase [Cellulomonas flavigena]ADG73389.1 peptidase C60 sortase A and B [Cellulomonas flavigena DSM 20109]